MDKFTSPIKYHKSTRTFDWASVNESDLGIWKFKLVTVFEQMAAFAHLAFKEWDLALVVSQCLNPTISVLDDVNNKKHGY